MKEKIAVSWSGGKDSCFALYKIVKSNKYLVDSLFTTVIEGENRVTSHGVRESLLERQAESLGIPLRKMYLPLDCPNSIYLERMDTMLGSLRRDGVSEVMFGDIFLKDIKAYRESIIHRQGLKAVFPLWGINTTELIQQFITLGFKTITTCIDKEVLSSQYLGRIISPAFLKDLPVDVDPCGENGEFHTFCFDGPLFESQVDFVIGEIVEKGRFQFCDLI